jgi:hypothetical protein
MTEPASASGWKRHLFYRAERTKTTWKFRLAVLALLVAGLWLTSGWWTVALGRQLVCNADLARSDAIVVENFDTWSPLLFESAARLRREGFAARVVVPVNANPGTSTPDQVALALTEVLVRQARLGDIEIVAIEKAEPISLNAARSLQAFMTKEQIKSVIVVTPMLRSRRSVLVYGAVLAGEGIRVHCYPVKGGWNVETWTSQWHGVQEVLQQWVKLLYYRLYVLPFLT